MKRRELMALAGTAALWSFVARAQPTKTVTIGILDFENPEPSRTMLPDGLRDLGYIEARNLRVEYRLTADIGSAVRNFAGISIGRCGRDRSVLPRLARSGFVLRSPRPVSRKREFSWIRLETFGNVRLKKFEHGSPETIGDQKSPRLAGLSHRKKEIL